MKLRNPDLFLNHLWTRIPRKFSPRNKIYVELISGFIMFVFNLNVLLNWNHSSLYRLCETKVEVQQVKLWIGSK